MKSAARIRAERMGTFAQISFLIAAPFVATAVLIVLSLFPAWALALIAGDARKRADDAWNSLPFKEQQ